MSSRFLICSLALVTLTFPAHADEIECRQTVPDASVVAKYPEVAQKAQDSAWLFLHQLTVCADGRAARCDCPRVVDRAGHRDAEHFRRQRLDLLAAA